MEKPIYNKEKKQRNGKEKWDWYNTTANTGKVPPHDRRAEEAVLGAILSAQHAFAAVESFLHEEVFYVEDHQMIFNACRQLADRGIYPDLITVVNELKANRTLDKVGGPAYVSKLTNSTSLVNLKTYCKLLLEKHLRRQMAKTGYTLVANSYDDGADIFSLLDHAGNELFQLSMGHSLKDYLQLNDLIATFVDKVEQQRRNKNEVNGVNTGFKKLNKLTGGWQKTDLIIIAARPSVGKTCFALNLARNAAMHPTSPVPVAFFSLEMNRHQIMQRIISAESMLPLKEIIFGNISDDAMQKIITTTKGLHTTPLYIDDPASLSIFDFKAKARHMVMKHGIQLIILDYLQLMNAGSMNYYIQNREQEVSTISRNLKALAKELKIPIIALSQLSRDVEKRGGNPMLSDLRDSGAIEQDADIVMFLSRGDYQEPEEGMGDDLKNTADVHIKKNRQGPIGTLTFCTDMRVQRWFEPEEYRKLYASPVQQLALM